MARRAIAPSPQRNSTRAWNGGGSEGHRSPVSVRYLSCGDTAFTVEFGNEISPEINSQVMALHAAIGVAQAEGKLPGVIETVPTMRSLMEELSSTENRIAFSRQAFNDAVLEYNTSREVFPNVFVANSFGFLPAEFFKIENEAEKAAIARALEEKVWPLLSSGRIRPQIHAVFPLTEASKAHEMLESSAHIGKIILNCGV